MEDLDRKGYFAFGKGGLQLLDNAVQNFSPEDMARLNETMPLILSLVKEMARPEIIAFARNTFLEAETEVQKPVDASLGSLIKLMNDPAVRARDWPLPCASYARGRRSGEITRLRLYLPSGWAVKKLSFKKILFRGNYANQNNLWKNCTGQ